MTTADWLVGLAAGIALGALIGWDEYRKERNRDRAARRQLDRLQREVETHAAYQREIDQYLRINRERGAYTGPRWERQR